MKPLLRYIIERFRPIQPVPEPVKGVQSWDIKPGRKKK